MKDYQKVLSQIKVEEPRVFKRGEIYMAELPDIDSSKPTSVQMGYRPILILQNSDGNQFSPTVIGAKITANPNKKDYPMHQTIELSKTSTILFEQIYTMDKTSLKDKVGELSNEEMVIANQKLMLSLGVDFYDLKALEVKKRTIVTLRNGDESIIFEIQLWSQHRSKTIEISLKELELLDIDRMADLSYVEQRLGSPQGIRILNKFTLEG